MQIPNTTSFTNAYHIIVFTPCSLPYSFQPAAWLPHLPLTIPPKHSNHPYNSLHLHHPTHTQPAHHKAAYIHLLFTYIRIPFFLFLFLHFTRTTSSCDKQYAAINHQIPCHHFQPPTSKHLYHQQPASNQHTPSPQPFCLLHTSLISSSNITLCLLQPPLYQIDTKTTIVTSHSTKSPLYP